MSEISRSGPATRDWLCGTVLEPTVDVFVGHLVERGYAPGTIASYLSCVAHFALWSSRERLPLERIDEDIAARFLDEHLPVCRCARRCRRTRSEVRAALARLLEALRANQLIAEKTSSVPSAIAVELRNFDTYLTEVCGLQTATRDTRLRYVHDFLSDRFGDTAVDMSVLEPADIRRFIMSSTVGWKPASIRMLSSSLRSYLRYKAVLGGQATALIAAIPCVAQWRLARLPRGLTAVEIRTLLGVFDRNTVGGRRDYAIARCYIDLGLRTSEIVRLELDDIDWRESVVHIRGKGRGIDGLPLPKPTGQAITAYLRKGRAKTASRALFLRLRPPLDRPAGPATIRAAVRNAARRCGLSKRLTGPHVLRHTLATQLVQNGTSLKEIADVLRHRSLDTTTIYAKVDLEALARVATSWPGRRA